jgi:hypothetical protein
VLYGWLALFAIMGGVLFEHRVDLGLDPKESPERQQAKARREHDKELDLVVDRVFAEWRGGAVHNAWRSVERHLRERAQPEQALRDLLERAERWPDQRLANRLAQELLPHLLRTRRPGEALDMVRARLRADSAFRPIEAGDLIKVAELARDAGDRSTARALLADFERRFPDNPGHALVSRLAQQLER